MKKSVLFRLLLGVSFLPFLLELPYCIRAMRISPAERWNWCFALWAILLAAVAVVLRRRRLTHEPGDTPLGEAIGQGETCRTEVSMLEVVDGFHFAVWRYACLLPTLLLLLYGYVKHIHLAVLLGGILLPYMLAACLFGWGKALPLFPSGGVLVLFCPSVGILLSALLTQDGVLLKLLCGLGFTVLLPCLLYCKMPKISLEAVAFCGLALLIVAGYWVHAGAATRHPAMLPVFDGLLSSRFRGIQESISASDRQFFGDSDIRRFLFNDQDGQVIQVLAVSRIDNIHQIHPTSYCLRVGGYQTLHEHAYCLPYADGETVEVLETLAERSGEKHLFWQWFSNSSYSTSSFFLFRTLYSPASDWSVFIVDMPLDCSLEEGQRLLHDLIIDFIPLR